MAKSVKCLALDFHSGHYLMGCGTEPHCPISGSLLGWEFALRFYSTPCSHVCTLYQSINQSVNQSILNNNNSNNKTLSGPLWIFSYHLEHTLLIVLTQSRTDGVLLVGSIVSFFFFRLFNSIVQIQKLFRGGSEQYQGEVLGIFT